MIRTLFAFFLLAVTMTVNAQKISGVVVDAETGDTLLYPSASYKGHHVAVSGSAMGAYSIPRHNGWQLTFSAVGYKSKTANVSASTPSVLNVKLKPDTK